MAKDPRKQALTELRTEMKQQIAGEKMNLKHALKDKDYSTAQKSATSIDEMEHWIKVITNKLIQLKDA